MTNWTFNKLLFKNERDKEAFKKVMVNQNNDVDFDMIKPQPVYLTLMPSSLEREEAVDAIIYLGAYGDNEEALRKGFLRKYPNIKQERLDYGVKTIYPLLKTNYGIARSDYQNERIIESWMSVYPELRNMKAGQLIHDDSGEAWSIPEFYFDHEKRLASYLNGRAITYTIAHSGYSNWYDWRCDHWGTKWNACDSYIGKCEIAFDTAWNPVEMSIMKEAAKRSQVDFLWVYEEEQVEVCFGGVLFVNGEIAKQHARGYNHLSLNDRLFLRDFFGHQYNIHWDEEKGYAYLIDEEKYDFDHWHEPDGHSPLYQCWQEICQHADDIRKSKV